MYLGLAFLNMALGKVPVRVLAFCVIDALVVQKQELPLAAFVTEYDGPCGFFVLHDNNCKEAFNLRFADESP